MTDYVLVLPETFPYWQTFIELRRGIGERLTKQGHDVCYLSALDDDIPLTNQVLFGANACKEEDYKPGCVVYNGEVPSSYWFKNQTFINRLAKASEVWSWETHTPYPYEAEPTHVPKVNGRVVHYGFLSNRRFQALSELNTTPGVSVTPLFNVWGRQLDEYLDSAELVVELLYDESWEKCSLRMFQAACRGAFCLSECDPDPERRLDPARISEQVQKCLAMSVDERLKWRVEQRQAVIDWLKHD
jgi:hypothetical protein